MSTSGETVAIQVRRRHRGSAPVVALVGACHRRLHQQSATGGVGQCFLVSMRRPGAGEIQTPQDRIDEQLAGAQ
jgi:hypothetical protein